ncbi:tetratricopeptide repeat protein [Candidatus Sumerlaeota bacterium]|nr:tetratricopeptide repeat protein [Candidatus Sumerlaeota bacterium]
MNNTEGAVEVHISLAKTMLAQEDVAGAERVLKNAIDSIPTNESLTLALANLYKESGQDLKALATLRRLVHFLAEENKWEQLVTISQDILTISPEDTETLISLADAKTKLNKLDEAITYYKRAADSLMKQKDYTGARACLDKALELAPDSPELTFDYATMVYNHEGMDSALPLYRKALKAFQDTDISPDNVIDYYHKVLEKEPSLVDIRRELVNYLFSKGLNDKAIEQLHKLADIYYSITGDLDSAIHTYLELKAYEPDNLEINERIADIYERKGDIDNAVRFYWTAAQTLLNLGEEEQALNRLQKVIELKPDDESALEQLAHLNTLLGNKNAAISYYTQLAEIRRHQGREEENESVYSKLLELDAELKDVRRNLAVLLHKKGDDTAAAEHYFALANSAIAQNNFDEAAENLKSCIELNPLLLDAIRQLTSVYKELGKIDTAVQMLLDAGDRALELGESEVAKKVYFDAQEIAPNNPLVIEKIAEFFLGRNLIEDALVQLRRLYSIYQQSGEIEKSCQVLEKVKQLSPRDEEVRKDLAHTLFQLGNAEESAREWAELFELVIQRTPAESEIDTLLEQAFPYVREYPEVSQKFADVLIASGREDKAINYLLKVATYLTEQGFDEKASESIKYIMSIREDNLEVLRLAIIVSERLGRLSEKKEYLKKVARFYTRQAEHESATRSLEEAYQIDSQDTEILNELAELYERLGNPAKVEQILFQLARVNQTAGNIEDAIATDKRILTFDPENVNVLRHLAELYLLMQDEENYYTHLCKIADILEKNKSYTEALATLEHLKSIRPEDISIIRRQAELLRNTKGIESARPKIQKVIDIALRTLDAPSVIEEYRWAISQEPENYNLRIEFASYLESVGKPKEAKSEFIAVADFLDTELHNTYEAITVLERAKQISPDDLSLLEKIGLLYLKIGNPEEASSHLLESARGWAQKDNPEQSIRLYRRVIEISPHLEEVYTEFAELLERVGRTSEAVETYLTLMERRREENRENENIPLMVKVLELEPERKDLRLELAEKFAADNLIADATFHYFILGGQSESAGRWDEAIGCYKRIKEINPENRKARERLTELFLQQNEIEQAKRELEELGEIALANNDTQSAEQYFRRITEIDPTDISAGERLGKIYEAQGDIERACEEYLRVSERFVQLGNPEKSIQTLRRVKELLPSDINIRKNILSLLVSQGANTEAAEESLALAELAFSQKDDSLAVEHCRKVRSLVPGSPELIVKSATLMVEQGFVAEALTEFRESCYFFISNRDFENAIFICDEALKHFPDNVDLRWQKVEALTSLRRFEGVVNECFTLAEIYERSNQPQKICECMYRILEFSPENVSALQKLIELKTLSGETEEALAQLETLIAIYRNQGNFSQAELYCRRALEIDKDNVSMRERLAELLYQQEKHSEATQEYFALANLFIKNGELLRAREVFDKILQISPDNLDALMMLRNVLAQLQETRQFVEVSNRLLALYGEQGAITEAIEVAEGIKDAEPDNIPIKYHLAHYYEQDGRIESAVSIYEELASQFESENNFEKAIDERLNIKRLQPQRAENLLKLGELYERQNNIDSARQEYLDVTHIYLAYRNDAESALSVARRVLQFKEEDIDAHQIIAESLKKLNKLEEAADEFSLLAGLAEKSGEIDKAITYLQEATTLSAPRVKERERLVALLKQTGNSKLAMEHLFLLAEFYESENKIADAVNSFQQILELEPGNLSAHQRLFEIDYFRGNKDSAVEHLTWLVDFYLKKEDLDKAESLLNQGLELDPESVSLCKQLAELLEKKGKTDDACVKWLKVAELYLMSGEIDAALQSLEKVKAFQPDNIETKRSLAVLYLHKNRLEDYMNELLSVINIVLEQGLIEEAEQYVQDLIGNVPQMPQVREKIAELYLKHKIPEMAAVQYLQLAQHLIAENRVEEAKPILSKVIEIDNENISAREQLVNIGIQEKDESILSTTLNELSDLLIKYAQSEKVIEILKRVVEEFTDAVEYREKLASLLEKTNRIPEAVEQWRTLAQILINRDELEKAAEIYKHISQIAPDDTRALLNYIDVYSRIGAELDLIDDYIVLANKYTQKGAFQVADQTFQQILKIAPDDPRILSSYIEFLLQRKEFEKLIPITERLTEIYLERGELRKGEKVLSEVIDSSPDRPELRLKLADILLSMNAKGKAVRELQRAAELFTEMNMQDRALSTLRTIINIFPDDTETRQRFIEKLIESRRFAEAVTESFTLADLYIKRGFLDLAENEYRRIISLQPDNFPAWNYLFETHIQLGPEDELIDDYLRLAKIYLSKNNPEEAAKIYKKLISLQPTNVDFYSKYIDTYLQFGVETDLIDEYFELAELLINKDKHEEAESIYKKILSLQPDNELAKEKLNSLTAPIGEAVGKELPKSDELEEELDEPKKAVEGTDEESLQDAIRNYLAILELNPQNVSARCKLASIYDQQGRSDEAYEQLSQAARIFISKGELEKGIDICHNLLHRNPADLEIRQLLNNALLQRDSFKAIESAIDFIEERQTEQETDV